MKDIDICKAALDELFRKNFQLRRTKYINDIVEVQKSNLYYLISVSIDDDNLILGFHEDSNYKIIHPPKKIENKEGNITYREFKSKDKEFGVKFITLDFKANYFLFADKLFNGISYFKTNASRDPENFTTKRRFVFKEEYITDE